MDFVKHTPVRSVIIDICPNSFRLFHESYWIIMFQMAAFKQLTEIRRLSKIMIDFDWQTVTNGAEAKFFTQLFLSLHEDSV